MTTDPCAGDFELVSVEDITSGWTGTFGQDGAWAKSLKYITQNPMDGNRVYILGQDYNEDPNIWKTAINMLDITDPTLNLASQDQSIITAGGADMFDVDPAPNTENYFHIFSIANSNKGFRIGRADDSDSNPVIDPENIAVMWVEKNGPGSKGFYRIPVGAFKIIPYLNLGFQLGFNLSSQYDVKNYGVINYDNLNGFLPIIDIALGAGFELPFGEIFLQFDLGIPLNKEPEVRFHSESTLTYPVDFTIPGFNIINLEICIGYRLLLGKVIG